MTSEINLDGYAPAVFNLAEITYRCTKLVNDEIVATVRALGGEPSNAAEWTIERRREEPFSATIKRNGETLAVVEGAIDASEPALGVRFVVSTYHHGREAMDQSDHERARQRDLAEELRHLKADIRRGQEIIRSKDAEIRSLRDQVVELRGRVSELELKRTELMLCCEAVADAIEKAADFGIAASSILIQAPYAADDDETIFYRIQTTLRNAIDEC